MKENITVVFATDDNYAQHTGVAMASVLLHAAEPGRFTFFIIDDNISFHKKQQLTDTVAQFGARIEFLAAGNQFDNVYISAHLSRAAYLRLAIGDLLPSRNRVIYLDADLIVRKDLAQLYDSNMHTTTLRHLQRQHHRCRTRFRYTHFQKKHVPETEPAWLASR